MQNKIEEIFDIFSKNNPKPQIELVAVNHFTLAVAVILSARTTDNAVNKATQELFVHYNTPQKMLELGEDGLKTYIKTIGLFNSKARNIIKFCQDLIDKHDAQVPSEFNELIALPGIGPKSANVIMNSAFGQKTVAVDTHVFRVAKRIGLSFEKTVPAVQKDLTNKIPDKWLLYAHHWLVLHGRYICKARKPLCSVCIISRHCGHYHKVS